MCHLKAWGQALSLLLTEHVIVGQSQGPEWCLAHSRCSVKKMPLESGEQRALFAKIDCSRASRSVAGRRNKLRQDKVPPHYDFRKCFRCPVNATEPLNWYQDKATYRVWPWPNLGQMLGTPILSEKFRLCLPA